MLLDLSHTAHTRARTGVQRVARALWREWGQGARPVSWDPYLRAWRELEHWELANLAADDGGESRGSRWPLAARIRGRIHRLGARTRAASSAKADALVVPEIFSAEVGAALPEIFAQTRGPSAAVFHDSIALRLPELTPAKSVARFPAYLQELLAFDGIAANSEDSRQALIDYWRWLGAASPPPVVSIPLGVDMPSTDAAAADLFPLRPELPIVLCVGTIEGRKNHLALLDACEALWARGSRFELHVIGLARIETAQGALQKIAMLQNAGHPLRYDGPADESRLAAAYRAAAFTVYPSLMEGFGLPVLESLAHGKPCVCSGSGALGESARGGGCVILGAVDESSLAGAIERLLTDSALLERLAGEARGRTFKSWADYAREVKDWTSSLGKKRPVPC